MAASANTRYDDPRLNQNIKQPIPHRLYLKDLSVQKAGHLSGAHAAGEGRLVNRRRVQVMPIIRHQAAFVRAIISDIRFEPTSRPVYKAI